MSDLIRRARAFATAAETRLRHSTGTPWPFEQLLRDAADVMTSIGADPELVAAAWLHDTVEETPATFNDLGGQCGARVSTLVAEAGARGWPRVSRPSGRRPRRAMRPADLSPEGRTLGLAVAIATGRLVRRRMPDRWPRFSRDLAAILPSVGEGIPDVLLRQAAKLVGPTDSDLPGRPEEGAGPPGRPPLFGEGQRRIERLFADAFTARDVAEPLRSFDGQLPAREAADFAAPFALDAIGVRQAGVVAGYALVADLGRGTCDTAFRPFEPDQIVDVDEPLSRVIDVLARFDHCFVRALDTVVGLVSRADMQKPLVRMWLFGIITLVEMEIARRIRISWPDDGWARLVPEQRLARARALSDERKRRGQPCELIDCLQLSDKAQVLMEDPDQLAAFGFDSRTAARRAVKALESLRNNLAHAQDIVTHDWAQIVRMARRFE